MPVTNTDAGTERTSAPRNLAEPVAHGGTPEAVEELAEKRITFPRNTYCADDSFDRVFRQILLLTAPYIYPGR